MTGPAQPLAAAVKAAVEARGLPFGDARKPAAVPAGAPWVVAWFDAGRITDRSLTSRDGFTTTVAFQCFGFTPESARIAAARVRDAVLSVTGAAVGGGWTVQMPSQIAAAPMQRDDDTAPPLFMAYDEWRFRLSPA